MPSLRGRYVWVDEQFQNARIEWDDAGCITDVSIGSTEGATHDAGDRLVTPGWVNAHTHLALTALRGGIGMDDAAKDDMVRDLFFAVESHVEPADVRAFARMGAYDALLSGTTSVWDHYYHADQVAAAMKDVGLCGVVAPTLQDLDGPGKHDADATLALTEQLHRDTELAAANIHVAVGPHATDTVSDELWRRATELSESLDIPIHAHLAQSLEELTFNHAQRGMSPVGWLVSEGLLSERNVFAHGIFLNRKDLAALAAKRSKLVLCPFSQMQFAFPARIDIWNDAEVEWAVATDCAASNDGFDLLGELRFVAHHGEIRANNSDAYEEFLNTGNLAAATSSWDARQTMRCPQSDSELLARVSKSPSRWHPGHHAGVIRNGALANFAIWDLSRAGGWPHATEHFWARATPTLLHSLIVAGKMWGTPGNLMAACHASQTYQAAKAEADARRDALLKRAGVAR